MQVKPTIESSLDACKKVCRGCWGLTYYAGLSTDFALRCYVYHTAARCGTLMNYADSGGGWVMDTGSETSYVVGDSLADMAGFNPRGNLNFKLAWNLALSANCSAGLNASVCRRDGDEAMIVVRMETSKENGVLLETHNISFKALVEALPSCELTNASIDTEALYHLSEAGLTVTVPVVDVDGLPIESTRQLLEVQWVWPDSKVESVPYERKLHEPSVYVSTIKHSRFSLPGVYDVSIKLTSGWSSALHRETSCVLLRRKIQVCVTLASPVGPASLRLISSSQNDPKTLLKVVAEIRGSTGQCLAILVTMDGSLIWWRIRLNQASYRCCCRCSARKGTRPTPTRASRPVSRHSLSLHRA